MKKIVLLILVALTLFLYSCSTETIQINLDYNNNQYELVTEDDKIDLKQFITYSKIYLVNYQDKEYSSNDQLLFNLNDGDNIFVIKVKNEEYQISIIKKYQCNVYIYDDNNTELDILNIMYNEKISSDLIDVNKFTPKGYTWNSIIKVSNDNINYEEVNINDYIVKGNAYIKLVYDSNEYEISLIDGENKETIKIKSGEEITLPVLEKTGYEFRGWFLKDNLFTKKYFDYADNIELVAKFKPLEFTIIYKNIDAEYNQTVKYDEEVTLYVPNKKGYIFKYWEYNNEQFTIDKWNILANIELNAVWEKEVINVTLETFGGKLDSNVVIEENGNIILPTASKEGYTFKYWCSDKNLKNKVESLTIDNYNKETLYAYYEYNSDNLKDQLVVTLFNKHASNYDEATMFDASQSGFTSLYWHKIAISKNDKGYYVSAIAENGDNLSTLGSYDYVVLAYTAYPYYNEFVNADYAVGYEVMFLVDPTLESDINMISFIGPELSPSLKAIQEHLSKTYGNIESVSSNISLLTQYNNFAITWQTSNREIITTKGVYKKPYMTRDVTLSAYIGDDLVYEFTVNVKGDTDTSTALSTGYIYTPYNTITQNAMDMLDIIYIAFLEIDENANWTNLSRVTSNINNYIRDKANKSGTKIVVSVNQSTSSAFPAVAASATLREKLANNIVSVIKDLELDGVDIDWETPTSSQATTFTLLMKDIYTKVKAENSDYLVTAAIGGGKWQPPKYDLVNSKQYLDYINLMTYSMTSGDGYFQNSLYPSTRSRTLVSCSVDESVKLYNSYGIENSKILLGIPFYVNLQKNCEGPGTKTGSGGSKWYNVMLNDYKLSNTMKEYFDEECGVPYRYDPTTKVFISYDNEQSIKVKCEYINTLGLAGIMYWQYGQDVDDYLTNAIKKYINS